MKSRLFDVQKNGTHIGPFEYDTLVRMLEAGMLQQDDLFREAGEEAWRPLLMLGEYLEALAAMEALPEEWPAEPEPMPLPPGRRSRAPLLWTLGVTVVAIAAILALAFSGHFRRQSVAPTDTAATPPSPPAEQPPANASKAPPTVDASAENGSTKPGAPTPIASNPVKSAETNAIIKKPEAAIAAHNPPAPEKNAPSKSPKPAEPAPDPVKVLDAAIPYTDPGQPYRPKAEQGDALQQALLADALLTQGWTDAQFKEGADWAEKSAKQNNALGQAILAEAIVKGQGRTPDPDRGREMQHANAVALVAGAENGPPAWQRWAARAPQRYFGTFPEAFETVAEAADRRDRFLRQAAGKGDFQAAVELAQYLSKKSDLPAVKETETIFWLRAAAEAHYPPAMHQLARLAMDGVGVKQDTTQAIELHKQAAALGWGWSQLDLAILDHELAALLGPNVKNFSSLSAEKWGANPLFAADVFRRLELGDKLAKNEEEAVRWLQKLSTPQQAVAIGRLIGALLDLRNREPQFADAEKWFTKLQALPDVPQSAAVELAHAARSLGLGDSLASPPRPEAPAEAHTWLLRSAALGSLSAMRDLGGHYAEGYLEKKDKVLARMWYRKAADTGDVASLWYYGLFLEKEGELAEAAGLFRKSMNGGFSYAVGNLANLLAKGAPGLPKDDAEATILYRKIATHGEFQSYSATAILCWRLRKGLGTALTPDEVSDWERKMEQTVQSKDPQQRGWLFDEVARAFASLDKEEEARWLSRAGAAGSKSALHTMSYSGKTPADNVKAIAALKELARQNDHFAMYELGLRYTNGEGVAKDPKEATKWFLQSAEAGNVYACFELGFRYKEGIGAPKDAATAFKWFKKAAEAKDAMAMFFVGLYYERGEGVRKDGQEALRWYEKAAYAGDVRGMVGLASMYIRGETIAKDYVRAYAWTNVAMSSNPDPEAKRSALEVRRFLEKSATRDQVADGQKLTRSIAAEIARRADPSSSPDPDPAAPRRGPSRASGTAWAITSDGYLVTCAHVVKKATALKVTSTSGATVPATVVKADTESDVALLKISSPTTALPLAFSAETGDTVATMGFPNADIQGREPKLTEGIVSSTSGLRGDQKLMQISVPVQPGNSGGPLVNSSGAVVGVVSSKLSDLASLRISGSVPQAVNFAVKTQRLESLTSAIPGWQKAKTDDPAAPLTLPELARKVRGSVYFVEVTLE